MNPLAPSEPTRQLLSNNLPVKGQCPMGCGQTLFLSEGGFVTCSWHACPGPAAAHVMLTEAPLHWAIRDTVERIAKRTTELMSGV